MTDPIVDWAVGLVIEELVRARAMHEAPRSPHEALGVLDEEFEEFRRAVHTRDRRTMQVQAKQLAAVCLRVMTEV